MKRKLFLGAITLYMLQACGEDRDEDNAVISTISQKIIGTWTIVKKESNGTNVPASLPCSNLGNFVFEPDKKLFENHNSVVNNNCVTDTDTYTYSVDENSKKITAKNTQNDVLIYAIKSLSDNELILVNTEANDVIQYTLSK